ARGSRLAPGRQAEMSTVHPATAREWHRFTPAERLARYAIYMAIVAAVVVSAQSIEIIPEFLVDAPEQFADMFQRMWPVAWGFYPDGVQAPLIDTLNIAALSTVFGLAMGIPVGFMAARNAVPVPLLNYAA